MIDHDNRQWSEGQVEVMALGHLQYRVFSVVEATSLDERYLTGSQDVFEPLNYVILYEAGRHHRVGVFAVVGTRLEDTEPN
jgi:hypothetical protein